MTDDIVTRLRESCAHTCHKCNDENAYAVGVEAADEIERLRAELETYKYLYGTETTARVMLERSVLVDTSEVDSE